MAESTWKQLVYDTANAYRTASNTTAKVQVGQLPSKIAALDEVTAEVDSQETIIDQLEAKLATKGIYGLEEKTVTAGTTVITVTPSPKKNLSKVTVNPTPTETKSVTPTTSAQTVTPAAGKHLSSVSVGAINTEEKSVTPTTSQQVVTPTSGKYLTKVTVAAVEDVAPEVTTLGSLVNQLNTALDSGNKVLI